MVGRARPRACRARPRERSISMSAILMSVDRELMSVRICFQSASIFLDGGTGARSGSEISIARGEVAAGAAAAVGAGGCAAGSGRAAAGGLGAGAGWASAEAGARVNVRLRTRGASGDRDMRLFA